MTIKLEKLPFDYKDLKSFLSKETLEYHHDKHHATYVNKLNDLIKGTKFENQSLVEIIKSSDGAIFNNSAQVFNHNFYWNCLSPSSTKPDETLLQEINKYFGSLENFKQEFSNKAINNFGSSWTWLVKNKDNSLEIINTSNAQTPITMDKTPLLTVDLWEHAYYIDYRNLRPKYLENFWNFVNWSFVGENLNI